MQKLLTIYLDNSAYAEGKKFISSYADKHGLIEEHITPYLQDGWRVVSINGFGGNSDSLTVRGWLAVLIEKDN